MPARCAEARPRRGAGERGQALVETALVVPLLMLLAVGVVGVGRVAQAKMAVAAVARESARAGALASTGEQAAAWGLDRGREAAAGYALGNGTLELLVDPGDFARGGRVLGAARYRVGLGDLPLLGWATLQVEGRHVEPLDPYRSRWSAEALR